MPKGKILAIDDEKFFRKLYSDILSGEGYEVVTADSGEEGVQIFARESFDIVISDMAMKGMDGLQTMEAVKKINPAQDVVIVTGIGDVQTAVNAMKKGVTDYILKPINPEDFLHLIKTIIGKQNLVAENSKLISENLEYFGILSVYQRCLSILSVLDMDRLQEIILDSVMLETNAQGSVLWLLSQENRNELKLATARGVVNVSSETECINLSNHKEWNMIKGGKPFYDRLAGSKEVNENIFFVPIRLEDRVIGMIKVSDKLDRNKFETKDLMVVKTIAGFASIALGNAWKVKEMEVKGFKDQKTGTYNIYYFTDYVTKEMNKARRYQRTFSILCLKIENYRELREEFKDDVLSDAIQGIINPVLEVIRDADILARARDDEYYILLPETDYFGSLMSIRRISKATKGKGFVSDLTKSRAIETGMRSVSFPKDGGSLKTLLEVVKKRMIETKTSLYARQKLGEIGFWGIFDNLVGTEDDYPIALLDGKGSVKEGRKAYEDEDGMAKNLLLTQQMLSQVHDVILTEIEMNMDTRGILYMGGKDMESLLACLKKHPSIESSATKLFLLGQKEEKGWELPNVTPVFASGDDMEKAQFLIFLSVDYAYALLSRKGENGMYYGIHTSDPIFVENMIAKLQENYHLQVQL